MSPLLPLKCSACGSALDHTLGVLSKCPHCGTTHLYESASAAPSGRNPLEPRFEGKGLSDWAADLDDASPLTRATAVRAMSNFGPSAAGALPRLLALLLNPRDSGDPDRMQAASLAVGRIRTPEAVAGLLAVLQAQNSTVHARGAVIRTLAYIGDRRAVEPLIAYGHHLLSEPSANESLLGDVTNALRRLKDRRAITLLERLAKSTSEVARRNAAEALADHRQSGW